MPFPLPELGEADAAAALSAADSHFLFLLEDLGVHRNTQLQLVHGGFGTPKLFARYGIGDQEVRNNLSADFDLKGTDGIQSRAEIGKVLLARSDAKLYADEEAKTKAENKANRQSLTHI